MSVQLNENIEEGYSGNSVTVLSNEVQEIISTKPAWIVRNGIVLFLLIILMLMSTTFFIAYPDIVNTKVKFTSINAPKEVKTRTEGKLIKLLATEGTMVKQNDILGFIESRADHVQMIHFSKVIDSIQYLLNANRTDEAVVFFMANTIGNSIIFPPPSGELEETVSIFMQSFHTFEQYLSSGYFLQKKKMMKNDIGYLQHLKSNLLKQRSLQEEDLGLAKQTLEANSTLNDDKVIAPFEYRNEKSKYISKSLVIPQSDAAIIGNESAQHEKRKEIAELENDIAQQKEIFRQAVNNMKARLDEWKNKYLLIAPVAGKIAFASFVQENQQLPNNQTICYINPDNSNYFAEMIIPQNNFGKVKEGQKVLLKLPSYPYQEFGMVTGRIDFISSIPTDSGYLAKIILPDGLQTNYKKAVQYHEGLLAEGEIITADTKLSDRLFYQLKSLLHNR